MANTTNAGGNVQQFLLNVGLVFGVEGFPEGTGQGNVPPAIGNGYDDHLAHIAEWTASGLAKPVIIHCRDAFDDLIPVLKASGLPPARFVFHCFTAGPREMQLLLDFGASVSFTGVATYRNATALREAIAMVPLDRMMVETDAPFLSPEPVRSVRPCEPAFVVHTARAIAALRGLGVAELEAILDRNARSFFGLPAPGATDAAS